MTLKILSARPTSEVAFASPAATQYYTSVRSESWSGGTHLASDFDVVQEPVGVAPGVVVHHFDVAGASHVAAGDLKRVDPPSLERWTKLVAHQAHLARRGPFGPKELDVHAGFGAGAFDLASLDFDLIFGGLRKLDLQFFVPLLLLLQLPAQRERCSRDVSSAQGLYTIVP